MMLVQVITIVIYLQLLLLFVCLFYEQCLQEVQEVHAGKEIRKCGYYLHLRMTTRAKSTQVRRIIMLVSEQNGRSG